MNKTELIERIAQEAEVPTSEAQRHFARPSSGW
jgi:nucleoid DNA-binding protein